jgi:hypothetical protein
MHSNLSYSAIHKVEIIAFTSVQEFFSVDFNKGPLKRVLSPLYQKRHFRELQQAHIEGHSIPENVYTIASDKLPLD